MAESVPVMRRGLSSMNFACQIMPVLPALPGCQVRIVSARGRVCRALTFHPVSVRPQAICKPQSDWEGAKRRVTGPFYVVLPNSAVFRDTLRITWLIRPFTAIHRGHRVLSYELALIPRKHGRSQVLGFGGEAQIFVGKKRSSYH